MSLLHDDRPDNIADKPNIPCAECAEDLLLEVKDLHTQFVFDEGIVRAVDGVSFNVRRTQVLGLVGLEGRRFWD